MTAWPSWVTSGMLGNVGVRAPPRRAPSGAAAAARTASPPSVAAPRPATSALRVCMYLPPGSGAWGPRDSVDDVPADHHGVVLMHQVVTVHRILPQKIAKAQEHPQALIGAEHVDIFAAEFVRRYRDGDPFPRLAKDAAFLEMDMHGMGPPATGIDQLPDLGAAFADRGAGGEHVKKLPVHRPYA